MAKEEGIEMEGVVTEVLPDRNYRVLLENGHEVLAYAAGNVKISDYLLINYVPGTGELTVVCGAIVGAGLAFLWYNVLGCLVVVVTGVAVSTIHSRGKPTSPSSTGPDMVRRRWTTRSPIR